MSKKKYGRGELLNRRQFLQRTTAFGFSFKTVPPLLWSLLHHEVARAEQINPVPFLSIHAAGGGGFYQYFVARDNNGQPLSGRLFPSHGVPSNQLSVSNGIVTEFGTPLWNKAADGVNTISGFTEGLLRVMSPEAISRTTIVAIPNVSGNDNTAGAEYGTSEAMAMLLTRLGVQLKVAHLVGLSNTPSGNGTAGIAQYPGLAKIIPQSLTDLTGVGTFSKTFAARGATESQMTLFADHINRYLTAKIGSPSTGGTDDKFKNIQTAAAADLMEKASPRSGMTPNDLNPARNAAAVQALGITNPNNFGNSGGDIMKALIFNVVSGIYPIGAFNMGGFDYHGGNFSSTLARDAALGDVMGRACELAVRLNKPLLQFCSTDGGLRATGITGPQDPNATNSYWAGDDSNYCMAFLVFTRPSTNSHTILKTQLGATASDTGRTDSSTLVGTARLATAAAIANWCALSGISLSQIDPVLLGAGIPQAAIDKIKSEGICFAPA